MQRRGAGPDPDRRARIGAAILAAGTSSRMGTPKQLLLMDGRPLLEHTLEGVRASRVSDVVLVLGFAADVIRQQIALDGMKVVVNEGYDRGLASSLRAALSTLEDQTRAALVVLADQPFVRPATLNAIIDRYQESDAQIVIPTYRGFRGNPVLLDRSVFHEVMALDGDIGCRAIFGNHLEGIIKVPVDDIGILLDLDTMSDVAKFERLGRGVAGGGAALDAVDLRGREIPGGQEVSRIRDQLAIVGIGPVAIALARLGRLLQFRVMVIDPILQAPELPDADDVLNTLDFSHLPEASDRYVVIASQGRFDEEAVQEALAAGISYVALVANPKRAQEIKRRLQAMGCPSERLASLRAPGGLDIGATSPEEIALSILAEIVSLRAKRTSNM